MGGPLSQPKGPAGSELGLVPSHVLIKDFCLMMTGGVIICIFSQGVFSRRKKIRKKIFFPYIGRFDSFLFYLWGGWRDMEILFLYIEEYFREKIIKFVKDLYIFVKTKYYGQDYCTKAEESLW